MTAEREQASEYLRAFKGDHYVFGLNCYGKVGEVVRRVGSPAALVVGGKGKAWGERLLSTTRSALAAAGVRVAGEPIQGARPNAPSEDVWRIAAELEKRAPAVVLCVGGGSTIDATKAALALTTLHDKYPKLDEYFGAGAVSRMLASEKRHLIPLVAQQTVARSGAHLTRYSNVTFAGPQKKLIVDDALTPVEAVFDYGLTISTPPALTIDGALDGFSHALEVLYGASGQSLEKIVPIATLAMRLILGNVNEAVADQASLRAREGLGLGTDLGAYTIMMGGTNGGHLTSFSLVDILSHGRACALMNPYYTVLFAPAIQQQLRLVARVLAERGYCDGSAERLRGRPLGVAVAHGIVRVLEKLSVPTRLRDVAGFTEAHINRALSAAKDPQLEMKLKNMPTPITIAEVDEYLGSVLEAAESGDFDRVSRSGYGYPHNSGRWEQRPA
jgi:alcohol dehydrogenase